MEQRSGERLRLDVWLIGVAYRISPALGSHVHRFLLRRFYELLNRMLQQTEVTFLNYGYASPDCQDGSTRLDQPDRYSMALYSHVAGAIGLRGKEVLEVSCGRGGGAAYIMTNMRPRSLVGVDISGRAIAFCDRRYRIDGLSFCKGNSERLPFPSSSFDAVLNVEASHNYLSMQQFLREVARVLRPGGHFLFADFRPSEQVASLRKILGDCGMAILEEECISANVFRALELTSEYKRALIQTLSPRVMRPAAEEFAAIEGTPIYNMFRHRKLEYLRFVLQNASPAS